MATYKVLQDIEAEDKLLGPLSLKQLIFAFIFVGFGFVNFRIATTTGLGIARWPLIAMLLLPTALFGILAAPFGRDQPTETWLLAKVRFFLKPRKRIWDQNGPKELVTITVPKKIERRLTKDFSQNEVRSRLDALANVMDSRGWAVKNINVNLGAQTSYLDTTADDRLLDTYALPQDDTPPVDVQASDDIMDTTSNATAQHFEEMIKQSEVKHRQELQNQIASARHNREATQSGEEQPVPAAAAADSWFDNQQSVRTEAPATKSAQIAPVSMPPEPLVHGSSGPAIAPNSAPPPVSSVPAPGLTVTDEMALLEKAHQRQEQEALSGGGLSHLKTVLPLDQQPKPAPAPMPQPAPNPDILNWASDNDKTVATLARQANKPRETKRDDGEVVVSLH